MRQVGWALYQLFVGYCIVLAFDGVEISVGAFCSVVVGGAFVASLMLSALMSLASVTFNSLMRSLLDPPKRRLPLHLRARRDPALTEWI